LDSDVELLFDGRVFISHTSDNSATIFNPSDRSFNEVALPQGAGSNVAVIGDGKVLFTVEGDNPYSMFYDPATNVATRLDSKADCLEHYGIFDYSLYSIMTYCGDNHGYSYADVSSGPLHSEYTIDIEYGNLTTYIRQVGEQHGEYQVLVQNGVVGDDVYLDDFDFHAAINRYDLREKIDLPWEINNAISYDFNTIYLTGGYRYLPEGYEDTVKEAYASSKYEINQLPNMWQDRADHAMVGLADNTLVVIGGHTGHSYYEGEQKLSDVEMYVPTQNKWFRAGSLNIPRSRHQAIQLLNGEIFVYGGATDPGPGYAYIGPPEIGRCEKINHN
jgi:hypothetical protein